MHRILNSRWWIVLAAIGIFGYGAAKWSTHEAIDFYQFWLVGQVIERYGPADIYNPASRIQIKNQAIVLADASGSAHLKTCVHHPKRADLELAGTPFLYALFSFLSSGDFDRDYRRYRLISLAVYLAGLAYLALALSLPGWGGCLILFSFTGFFWAFDLDVFYANITQTHFGLLIFSLGLLSETSRYRNIPAGLIMAGLVFFKPIAVLPLICLIVLWIFSRERAKLFSFLLGFAGGSAMCIAAPLRLFGSSSVWLRWLHASSGIILKEKYIRRSFLYTALGITDDKIFALAAFLAILGFSVFCFWFCRNRPIASRQPHFTFLAASLALNLFMLTSPLIHGFYFLMLALSLTTAAADFLVAPGIKEAKYHLGLLATASVLILGQGFLFKIRWVPDIHGSAFLYLGVIILGFVIAQRIAIKGGERLQSCRQTSLSQKYYI
jgi:hypothetical protein